VTETTHGDAQPLLSIRDLTVLFGGVRALSEVTFDVNRGDVVAVVGPNGAGKSTMLNSISGLVRDNAEGGISFEGNQVLGHSPVSIVRAGVGRSFQDPPLIDTESVLENVLLGAHARSSYGIGAQMFRRGHVRRLEAEATERAESILDFVGLAAFRDRPVAGLPYGRRKLIDIARAILAGPKLLLLDEPTSGLDGDEQKAVARLLNELHRTTPVTILLVEHHMDIVRSIASTVIGLAVGAIVATGTPGEVLDSAEFRSVIVGANVAIQATAKEQADRRRG
jgi:branched-chain amino acid transport system ATP-binding protein